MEFIINKKIYCAHVQNIEKSKKEKKNLNSF